MPEPMPKKVNEVIVKYENGLILMVDADTDNIRPDGTVSITILSHPRKSNRMGRSFSWKRDAFVLAVKKGVDAEAPLTATFAPVLLREIYEAFMQASEPGIE